MPNLDPIIEQPPTSSIRRIMVIGCSGAGKSTLARRLGEILGLPVIHLDREHWQPGWVKPTAEQWDAKVRELAHRPVWIIDGNYGGLKDWRFDAADMVIFLDLPRWRCLERVIRRRIRYHGRSRPDMTPGCPEKIDLAFLRWVWQYRRTQRPEILCKLNACRNEKHIVVLTSPRTVQGFVETLADRVQR